MPEIRMESVKNELLVVSFGTSYNDSRRLTIGAIEDAVEKAFRFRSQERIHQPDYH